MYDLKLIVPTASLQAIVMRSALPSGWMAAVTDATGVLVARTRKPEHYIGRRAGPGLLAFLAWLIGFGTHVQPSASGNRSTQIAAPTAVQPHR